MTDNRKYYLPTTKAQITASKIFILLCLVIILDWNEILLFTFSQNKKNNANRFWAAWTHFEF